MTDLTLRSSRLHQAKGPHAMETITRKQSTKRFSQSVSYNGIIYLTGQVSTDRSLDVGSQTTETLRKIDALLEAAGSDKTRVLFAQVWLKNVVKDFDAMNAAWETWTALEFSPARATVQADLANENILVEIAVTAAVNAASKV